MAHQHSRVSRRALLGTALVLPVGGCASFDKMSESVSNMFAPRRSSAIASRGERMARMIQNEGRDAMMAPEAFAVMGLVNGGRDIPVKQFAEDGPDGRYVISLVNIRNIHEFVVHRRQGDVLVFHHCDSKFVRLSSVRYPRNGKPTFITDTAFAEVDFQQQITFWFDRMPGR